MTLEFKKKYLLYFPVTLLVVDKHLRFQSLLRF